MSTVIAAAFTALIIMLAGSLPWSGFGPIPGLGALNLGIATTVPWGIVPMALYLAIYWRCIGGGWGNGNNAARRNDLRANSLPLKVWGLALAAGLLGFAALLALLAVMARLLNLPEGPPITTPASMPLVTGFLLLAMQSTVAGVTEEAAFRGYMQSAIERQHGLAIALLANGIWFGLLHFSSHPADVLLMLPYYISVSAVYGGLTWATNSILPALVLHVVGDSVMLTRWWLTGLPEWKLTATTLPLLRDSGIDGAFIGALLLLLSLACGTVIAYRALHKSRVATAIA